MGQLQQLVDCAFKMATGQTEALRPIGLRLLRTLLRYFGAAEDPAMEGARLMEQYQAQFVSALRCDPTRPCALSCEPGQGLRPLLLREAESSIRLASSVCRHLCGKRKAEGFSRVAHAAEDSNQLVSLRACQPQCKLAIVRRSALAHGVVPTLAASGAALAVTVLRAGLAADAAVLSRILTLLKVALDVLRASSCIFGGSTLFSWTGTEH